MEKIPSLDFVDPSSLAEFAIYIPLMTSLETVLNKHQFFAPFRVIFSKPQTSHQRDFHGKTC